MGKVPKKRVTSVSEAVHIFLFVKFLNVLHLEKSKIKRRQIDIISLDRVVRRFRSVSESKATEFTDVHDPATNELLCRTPKCTKEEMETAVKSAKEAYEKWKNTSVLTRQTLMLKYQTLIREHSVSLFVFQLYLVSRREQMDWPRSYNLLQIRI